MSLSLDINTVLRYDVEMYYGDGQIVEDKNGSYVDYDDYERVLNSYLDLLKATEHLWTMGPADVHGVFNLGKT